ncbi:hypothetical protein ACSYAD_30005 [Acaryochloris marina NIES-2412]|uniref:hypothetical protein n=1 Tax=Acaryochloris marina TaxID=155978 RepID=UPI00405906AD
MLTGETLILNNTNKSIDRVKSSWGYLMNQLIQKLEALSLDRITLDPEIQPRQQLSQKVVAEYAEAMTQGATFPPVIVFYDGSKFWLADGFHRIAAKQANGDLEILSERKFGSRREAVLFAAGANATHGLRRTNADKRRVVARLLKDPEWCQMSDNAIAHQCGVSQPFVGKLRQQLLSTYNDFKSTSRKGADGRIIDVSNIGHNNKQKSWNETEFKSDKIITLEKSQKAFQSDSFHGYPVNHYIKHVHFPLNCNGKRLQFVKGTVTHLQITWKYGNQTRCTKVPINQVMFLDSQSVG